MKLPRDVSGHELARVLARRGYEVTRQTGSLTSKAKGAEHHVTVPAHGQLRVGTWSQILSDVAAYLDMSREELIEAFFG